ncbi:MAG: hypothetical protein O2816_17645 [Planctomycetota bacterium]|nr:hypothetical protein [Planctomycetota bacterium]
MKLELLAERTGDGVTLASPEVGYYTCAPSKGCALIPGQRAGVLRSLGREIDLVVPAGIWGIVTLDPPERVLAPVGYGDRLLVLSPLAEGAAILVEEDAASEQGLVLRATSAGRFYHRPAPDEPAFLEPGDALDEGTVVGLIEVMKTFNHVTYAAAGGLPARARLVAWVARDGADVTAGEALVQLEEA